LISPSHASSCSGLRQFAVGNEPTTPLRHAATTSSTPETRNIGAAIKGRFNRSRKRKSGSEVVNAFLPGCSGLVVLASSPTLARPNAQDKARDKTRDKTKNQNLREDEMSNPLYAFPAVCEQTLRALARYPSRTAFS